MIDVIDRSGQTAFVTGGLGFIGKHLCKKLLSFGFDVISLDDESSSSPDATDFILSDFDQNVQKRFKKIYGSILDYTLVANLMNAGWPDNIVFHLAATLGVKNVIDHPLETLENNIKGTENVLRAAAKLDRPVFIASSSEVYGKSDVIPFLESGDLTLGNPSISRWGYAASKILDEFQAFGYAKSKYGLNVVVGRFFNIVGPGQLPGSGMVIPKMVEAAREGRNLEVFGDGSQRRCFCHVDDCVEALCSLMLSKKPKEAGIYGQIFNIGNPKNEISILDLAKKVTKMFNEMPKINLVPYSEVFEDGSFEDMTRRVPSIKKIGDVISWKPKLSLDKILEDVVDDVCARAKRYDGKISKESIET